MTYQVLLVDDEPIILSGIKFLIDWEKNGCSIAGTARNGRQALDLIAQIHPDIVLCDINMPVLSGIEVIRTMADQEDAPVFIMLTNLDEFDLARQALRYKAVDYLLKSQLEEETLEHSLDMAKQECLRRGRLARVERADSFLQSSRTQIVAAAAKALLAEEDRVPDSCAEVLSEQGVLESYCFVQLMMDFTALPTLSTFSSAERNQLFDWEREVVEKLAGNVLPAYAAFDPDDSRRSMLLLCWNVPESFASTLNLFSAKLYTASNNITQTRISILSTGVLHGSDSLKQAVWQLAQVREHYYLTQCDSVAFDSLPLVEPQPLHLEDLSNKLIPELRVKNAARCRELLNQAAEKIGTVPHRLADARNVCAALYSVASLVLPSMLPLEETGEYFIRSAEMMNAIRCIATKKEALAWLKEFERQVTGLLEQMTEGRSSLTEKARSYVLENVEKRIMLQDVANHVNISPSYLSALFKKEFNQNLIDYINTTKMEHACVLIREGKYRIYEISYKLGFENAYYFTKVFKRHTGLTPTDYQRKLVGKG